MLRLHERGPTERSRSGVPANPQPGCVLYDDRTLRSKAGFRTNLRTSAWTLAEGAGDADPARVRDDDRQLPERRLAFADDDDPETTIEPAFEPSIGVEPNASTGSAAGSPVVSKHGAPYEVRNRQALCRCGNSRNKPFCDGSHKRVPFQDDAMPAEPRYTGRVRASSASRSAGPYRSFRTRTSR